MTLPGAVALIVWSAAGGRARAAVGAAGGLSITEPVAARPAALAEAYGAASGRADALQYNPAGIAALAAFEGSAMVHAGFAGDTLASFVGGGTVKGFGVAASAAYFSAGEIEVVLPTGRAAKQIAEQDLVGTFGLAHRLPLTPVLCGAAGKVISSRLLEAPAVTDFAADLGVQLPVPAAGLTFGAALQHWGGHLRYDAERYPVDNNDLPLQMRFGASLSAAVGGEGLMIGTMESLTDPAMSRPPPPHVIRAYAEALVRTQEHAVGYAVAAEYEYGTLLALRAGYRTDASGVAAPYHVLTLGAGAGLGAVRLDYAAEVLPAGVTHRVGLGLALQP